MPTGDAFLARYYTPELIGSDTARRGGRAAWITGPTVPGMPRTAIGAWILALFIGILTYYFLGDVPEIGNLLQTIGWVVVIALVLYGVYAIVAGRRRA